MQVGEIKKISKIYAEDAQEASLEGVEVCIIRTDGKIWPYLATVISGEYKGEEWFFSEDELV